MPKSANFGSFWSGGFILAFLCADDLQGDDLLSLPRSQRTTRLSPETERVEWINSHTVPRVTFGLLNRP